MAKTIKIAATDALLIAIDLSSFASRLAADGQYRGAAYAQAQSADLWAALGHNPQLKREIAEDYHDKADAAGEAHAPAGRPKLKAAA